MKYSVHLDETDQIIVATAEGNWDDDSDDTLVEQIMELVIRTGVKKVLVNLSGLSFEFSIAKVFERGNEMKDLRKKKQFVSSQVAIVYASGNQMLEQNMQFFETVTRNRGLPYRVFDNLQDARDWLSK